MRAALVNVEYEPHKEIENGEPPKATLLPKLTHAFAVPSNLSALLPSYFTPVPAVIVYREESVPLSLSVDPTKLPEVPEGNS